MKNIRINVKYTSKDLISYCVDERCSKIEVKIIFSIYGFSLMMFLLAYLTGDESVKFPYNGINNLSIYMFIGAFFIVLFLLIPILFIYLRLMDNFQKYVLQCFEFTEDGMTLTMRNSRLIQWSSFSKIKELKSCFILINTSLEIYLIPKRCFNDQKQLDEFFEILTLKTDEKKLKLKKYPLKKIHLTVFGH